jgi:hypothetical protein
MPQLFGNTVTIGTTTQPYSIWKGWWATDGGINSSQMGDIEGYTDPPDFATAELKGIYGVGTPSGFFVYVETTVESTEWNWIRISDGTKAVNLRRTDASRPSSIHGNARYEWAVASGDYPFDGANGSLVAVKWVDNKLPDTTISMNDLIYEYVFNASTPPPTKSMSDFYRGGVHVATQNFDATLAREPSTGEYYVNGTTEWELGYNQSTHTIRWQGATVVSNGSGNPASVTIGNTIYWKGTLRNSYAPFYYDHGIYRFVSTSSYYDVNVGVPSSGQISLSQFQGKSNVIP